MWRGRVERVYVLGETLRERKGGSLLLTLRERWEREVGKR